MQRTDTVSGVANGSGRSAEFLVSAWIVGIGRGRVVLCSKKKGGDTATAIDWFA